MRQQQLAVAQARDQHQVGPHRAGDLGQPGRVHQVHPGGDRQQLAGRHRHVLGVPAAGQQRANLLPHRPFGDTVADLGDDAGHLHADGFAGARWRRVLAGGLQHVGAVHAGGGHLDDDLAGPGGDVGHFLPRKLIGGFGDDGAHGGHATEPRYP